WNNVQLSLVSGTPVSFIQPIQNPVYRHRPVIPFSNDLNLSPQTYEPGELGSGSIGGVIKDAAGALVSVASLVLINTSTNQTTQVTTDGEGRFFASNLPTGSYRLKASMRGFKNTEVQEVNISGGKRTQLGINLEVGTVSESVSISGQAVTTQSVND